MQFDVDAPVVLKIADWQVALIADLDTIPDLTNADIGKVAYVEEDGVYRVLQSVDDEGTYDWRADPSIRLSVEGPIVVDGNVTAKWPLWHGRQIKVVAAATITLPEDLPVGFTFHVHAATASAVTLVGGGTATLSSTAAADDDLEVAENGWASVILVGINAYNAVGNVSVPA
jgi:hypothetical protein